MVETWAGTSIIGSKMMAAIIGGSPESCIGELMSSPTPGFPEITGGNKIEQGNGTDIEI